MAIFSGQEAGEEALDWVILRDGGVALYWRPIYLDEDLNWLRKQAYQVFEFNCERWVSGGMHADLERTLSFPSYYGHNLDALHDCLEEEFVVPENGGVVVAFRRFDEFVEGKEKTEAGIVLDIFARASRYFLLSGKRFLTLAQSNDPTIHFDRLAAVSTAWNWRERLDKNRGL